MKPKRETHRKHGAPKARNLNAETNDYLRRRALLNSSERRKRLESRLASIGKARGEKSPVPVKKKSDKRHKTNLPRARLRGTHIKPMEDHVDQAYGVRTITYNYNGTDYVYPQVVLGFQKILQYVVSAHGDFKHPTNHSYQTRRINYGQGPTYDGNSAFSTSVVGTGAVGFGLSSPRVDMSGQVYNQALSRVYDKIRGGVDLSIDIAESHKGAQMMRQTLKAMKNVSLTFRKMRRSNPRDWGNLWLEFTYGWKPLAQAVYGGLDRYLNGHRLSYNVKETARELAVDRIDVQHIGSHNHTVTSQINEVYQARIVASYVLAEDRLTELAGYTSLNPVSIAWELTPYSFVVDWFVDVGGYLRSYESSLLYGSDFVQGYSDERNQQVIGEVAFASYAEEDDSLHTISARGDTTNREFRRHVLASSPSPRPPRIDPRLGTSRLLSAASLLGQQLHSLEHRNEKSPPHVWKNTDHYFDWNSETRKTVLPTPRRGK